MKKETGKHEGRIKKIFRLYDTMLYTLLSEGDTAKGRRLTSEEQKIGIDFSSIYDSSTVMYLYTINKLPKNLLIDFKGVLRESCKEGIRITFLDDLRRHTIEWDSAQMLSRLRILKDVGKETDEKDVNAYNLHSNIGNIEEQKRIEDSLIYLSDADKSRGRALFKSTMFVLLSGPRGVRFDESVKAVENMANHLGFDMERVLFEIPAMLSYASPFKHECSNKLKASLPTQVLTDEIVSRYNVYTQGKLGKKGIYFGTDIYSLFSVLKTVKMAETSTENILITAESGGGKSFLVKALLLQLLGLGYNGTIMDIEGMEYLPMAEFLSHNSKVTILNMGEGRGKYFDPVEILYPTGSSSEDEVAKKVATDFTLAILKVLLGKTFEEDTWYDTVLNDAIAETYRNYGITEEPETWTKSKGLTLKNVYETLKTLERFREDEDYSAAVLKSIAIMDKYFAVDGSKATYFSEKAKLEDIIDSDLVVCSFGMAGKSPQAVDPVQMALMQLSAAQLSYQRSIFSYLHGKFNFKVWEEFQRWGKFPDSEKTIGVALTGGRKLGDVNFIITNVVKNLLVEDKFDIFENVTSFLIGAIGNSTTRKSLCEALTIPKMLPELDAIASASAVIEEEKNDSNGNEEEEVEISPYKYAFLCGLDRNKYSVVKMLLPRYITNSAVFKTGVTVSADVKKEEGLE